MKNVIGYKNYICVAFAFLMTIIGVYLCENQMDSSFALRVLESSVCTLDDDSATLQDTVYAKEELGVRNVIDNRGRTNFCRIMRCGKMHENNLPSVDIKYGIIRFLQQLDIRMCRTDNLTQVFNVLYIQHQDGVKGAYVMT